MFRTRGKSLPFCPVWINKNAINWLDLVLYRAASATLCIRHQLCALHSPLWFVHRGSLPPTRVGTVQTLSAPCKPYWTPLDPPILSFAIHTAHHPVPSVTKTLYLKNVSTWQIEATHAIYVKLIKWNKKLNSENQCSDLYKTSCCPSTFISHFKMLL